MECTYISLGNCEKQDFCFKMFDYFPIFSTCPRTSKLKKSHLSEAEFRQVWQVWQVTSTPLNDWQTGNYVCLNCCLIQVWLYVCIFSDLLIIGKGDSSEEVNPGVIKYLRMNKINFEILTSVSTLISIFVEFKSSYEIQPVFSTIWIVWIWVSNNMDWRSGPTFRGA